MVRQAAANDEPGSKPALQELRRTYWYPNYQETADKLGMNLNTLKSHIHRLRERWKDALMAQVACALDEPAPDNIKAELSELIGCV